MQLILESETSVDLKPKMSLSEENVEKSALDVVAGIQNGDISNGDDKIVEKCVSDIVNDVEKETKGESEANGIEVTKDNDETPDGKEEEVEKSEQMQESETVETDNKILDHDREPTNGTNAEINTELNDIDTSTILNESVDIKQEIEDMAVDDEIKTEINEDLNEEEHISENTSEIKKEIPQISNDENNAILDSNPQNSPEDSGKSEPNETDMKQIIIKAEVAESSHVPEEKDTVETDNVQNNTSDENVDLMRLDNSVNNGDKPSESVNNETTEEGLSNADRKIESSITDDVTQMDVDSSVQNLDEEEKSKMDSITPMSNTTESTESKDCDSSEVAITEKTLPLLPNPECSDDSTTTVDAAKEKEIDSTITETQSDLEKVADDKPVINCDDVTDETENVGDSATDDPMSIDEIIDLDETVPKEAQDSQSKEITSEKDETCKKPDADPKSVEPVLKLSNTLDILSDDEEEQIPKGSNTDDGKCINIEDDDDIMLIDDDTSGNESKLDTVKEDNTENHKESKPESSTDSVKNTEESKAIDTTENVPETDATVSDTDFTETIAAPDINEKIEENKLETEMNKPLIPENFLKTCKKNLADMTREELEEFCILKLVESILDRSNLSEIKNKLKILTQNLEEYKKKAMMLSKQNRDLQVVFKSVQEDVKKCTDTPIVPLKITRSVGMQVLMSDKPADKRRRTGYNLPNNNVTKPARNPAAQGPRPQKLPTQQIPVPRLVPATNNPATKSPQQQVNAGKTTSPLPNGVKSVSPVQKGEKRSHNRVQSVTVDLTDDEPPAKVVNRTQGPMPPVRLVPSQNLLAPPRAPVANSPRKVYIPISGPQGQNIRPGQTIMLKSVPSASPRPRVPPPHMVRMPQSVRMTRPQGLRHPAPLPECMKQYQPPNWKALPPAPDLKLAKVENGIVISWKIEGYQEDSYEEIASYQLYAYQETSSPPNTALWKKIGDVKALPLPMACTLTQFMAGYKYYFAVRAVDIRSRLGPFSLPGSILLLNKM